MPAPSVLPGRAYQTTARNSNAVLDWRANDLSLTARAGGTMTLTRASDAGYTLKRGARHWKDPGYERRMGIGGADDQPSWDWVLNGSSVYVPALSLSGAFTNLVTSDDFDGGWDSDGTPVVTTGVSDPLYGTGGFTIADDNAGAAEGKYLAVSFTGNAVKGIAFVVKEATMATSGVQSLTLRDTSAPAVRLSFDISAWSTSAGPTVAASTGTLLGTRRLANGYWAVFGKSTSVTAANDHRLEVYPAATAAATGSITVWRVNAYNSAVPCPEILSASVARAADIATLTFPTTVVREMSGMVEFVEQGTVALSGSGRVWNLSNSDPRIFLSQLSGGGKYLLAARNKAGTQSTATAVAAPAYGDLVRIWWWLEISGSNMRAHLRQAVGASGFAARVSGDPVPIDEGKWADAGFTINSLASGALAGVNAHISHRVRLGCAPAGEF